MGDNQESRDFSKVSINGPNSGTVIGEQKFHAESGGTINVNKVFHKQSGKLAVLNQQKALDDYTSTLRTLYKLPQAPLKTLSWVKDIPLASGCVDLHLEEGGTSGRLENWIKLNQFPDILKGTEPNDISGNILLTGPPGSGKTTLFWKTAYDWAERSFDVFSVYSVLLVYSLKDLPQDKSLEEEITREVKSKFPEAYDVPFNTFLQDVKKKLILMLDGYDELSENQKAKVHAFLGVDSPFFISTKVVSTREFSGDEQFKLYFPKKVRILELEKPMLMSIITVSCPNPETVNQVIKFLSTNKNCTNLFKTSPLLIACLCFVYDPKNSSCETVAGICLQVIEKLFEPLAKKNQALGKMEEFLNKLGEVSFKTLMDEKDSTITLPSLQANDQDHTSSQDNHLSAVKEAIHQTGLFTSKSRSVEDASQPGFQQTGIFRRLDSTKVSMNTNQSERENQVELIHPLFTESLAVNFWDTATQEKKKEVLGGMNRKTLKNQGLFLINKDEQSYIVVTHGRINFLVKTNESVAGSSCVTTSDVGIIARNSTFKKPVLFTQQGLDDILKTESPLSLEKATDSLTLCKLEEMLLVLFFLNVYFFLCHIFSGAQETEKLYALKKYMYIYVLILLSPIMVCNVRRARDSKLFILASVLLASVFRFLHPVIVYIFLKPSWPNICFSNSTYFQYFIIDFICVGGYLLLLSYRFVFPLVFMLKENREKVPSLIVKVAIQISIRQLWFFRMMTTYYFLVLLSNRLVMERKYSDCKMIMDAIGGAVHLVHLFILEIVSYLQIKSVLTCSVRNRAVQEKSA